MLVTPSNFFEVDFYTPNCIDRSGNKTENKEKALTPTAQPRWLDRGRSLQCLQHHHHFSPSSPRTRCRTPRPTPRTRRRSPRPTPRLHRRRPPQPTPRLHRRPPSRPTRSPQHPGIVGTALELLERGRPPPPEVRKAARQVVERCRGTACSSASSRPRRFRRAVELRAGDRFEQRERGSSGTRKSMAAAVGNWRWAVVFSDRIRRK
jgi:hypothetical protein